MNDAEKIGLFPGFGWLTGHNLLVTLLICWLITPGAMFVLAFVGESRTLPVSYEQQYRSFFPGDLFLGMMTAGLLAMANLLPDVSEWYNARWWHMLVITVTFTVAIIITISEYKDPNGYGQRAVLSPTKLYHNLLLYGAYGYVIVVTLVALVVGLIIEQRWAPALLLFLALSPGFIWLTLLNTDNRAPVEIKQSRSQSAHINDWKPLWIRP